MYILCFVLQFIAVVSLAMFITAMGIYSVSLGALIGFGAGAGLLLTLTGTTGIFSETPVKLHLIDNGYHVAGLTLSGMILGWM